MVRTRSRWRTTRVDGAAASCSRSRSRLVWGTIRYPMVKIEASSQLAELEARAWWHRSSHARANGRTDRRIDVRTDRRTDATEPVLVRMLTMMLMSVP